MQQLPINKRPNYSTQPVAIGASRRLPRPSEFERWAQSIAFRTVTLFALTFALLAVAPMGMPTAYSAEASRDSSAPSQLKRLVVLDIELTGDLGGKSFEAEHEQRLRMVSARLRDELQCTHRYSVVDNAPAKMLIDRLKSEQYLHRCNGCEFDIARQLNADQVLVPWVYRMSNLVLTLHIEIRDVATRRTLMKKALDFRGDNDTGWTRAIDYLIRGMKQRSTHDQ